MRTELLLLVPESESFCSSKTAFVDFLKLDSLITISGQKISLRRAPTSEDIVTARFSVETDIVKSKQERYFLLALECTDELKLDEFNELCDRVRKLLVRLSPTAINTIWDDVGRIYAERSYPLINEVENLLRRLIAKFMLITVGVTWSRDTIHPELFKKIEKFDDPEPYVNDLFKLDFIHLKQVLFEKKRDISIEELDRVLAKTRFSDEDKEKIQKYLPRSNWEKYFSNLIDDQDSTLEKKWELLYKLRNKVAHNRHVKKEEHEKIKGLTSAIKVVLAKASAKLGDIDLNAEDRELIIHSYTSESPSALYYLAEKAVAEYYLKCGYELAHIESNSSVPADFIATKDGARIAVDVKLVRARTATAILRMIVERRLKNFMQWIEFNEFAKLDLVVVIREEDSNFPIDRLIQRAARLFHEYGSTIDVQFGRLKKDGGYVPWNEAPLQ